MDGCLRSADGQQDQQCLQAVAEFGSALDRLARGYEADPDQRRDLRQDIDTALWRSLAKFDGRCSLRTWVFRVAHNVGASHVLKRRSHRALVGLEELEQLPSDDDPERTFAVRDAMQRLLAFIQALTALDRQLVLLYLEDLDAAAIGEITGLSPGAVAVRIHRIKATLAQRYLAGGNHGR